jgi:hypothetical protein
MFKINPQLVGPIIMILISMIGLNRARSPDIANLAMATGCVGFVLLAIKIAAELLSTLGAVLKTLGVLT